MRVFAEIVDGVAVNAAVFGDTDTPGDIGLPGYWVLTDAATTKKRGAPGDTFHDDNPNYPDGAFTPPRMYATWRLDDNLDWQPPVDKPYPDGWGDEDSGWYWEEVVEEWIDRSPLEGG